MLSLFLSIAVASGFLAFLLLVAPAFLPPQRLRRSEVAIYWLCVVFLLSVSVASFVEAGKALNDGITSRQKGAR